MSQLMLVNPRKRARSAAQKAATRRMLAANRSKRHSNPKRRAKRHSVARHHNPIRTRTRHVFHAAKRRRHNPSLRAGAGNIGSMLMNSIKGAGGAIVVNVVTNYLPDTLKTGQLVYVTRAALAIAFGMFGGKVLGSSARTMAEGALTVNMHDFINSLAGAMLPGSGLHSVGSYINTGLHNAAHEKPFDSELNGMGEYMNT
jgi:hypothetical protein